MPCGGVWKPNRIIVLGISIARPLVSRGTQRKTAVRLCLAEGSRSPGMMMDRDYYTASRPGGYTKALLLLMRTWVTRL